MVHVWCLFLSAAVWFKSKDSDFTHTHYPILDIHGQKPSGWWRQGGAGPEGPGRVGLGGREREGGPTQRARSGWGIENEGSPGPHTYIICQTMRRKCHNNLLKAACFNRKWLSMTLVK
jgi:hypothetical protein